MGITIEADLVHTKGALQNHEKSTAVDCVVHNDEQSDVFSFVFNAA